MDLRTDVRICDQPLGANECIEDVFTDFIFPQTFPEVKFSEIQD